MDIVRDWVAKTVKVDIPEPQAPMSKSYLKIVGVNYHTPSSWHEDRSTHLQAEDIMYVMHHNNLFDGVCLASSPHIMKASVYSDMAVIWFDIWDLQKGTKAKALINKSFNFSNDIATVIACNMHPGIPQCQNCWQWGHNLTLNSLRVFSFNVNRNYSVMETLLVTLVDNFDIIFFQEPTWNIIRKTVSANNVIGKDVIGAPIHPDWIYLAPSLPSPLKPRVMAYVHKCLSYLQPSIVNSYTDLDRDILVLSLSYNQHVHYLMNIYSDDKHLALDYLQQCVNLLPPLLYIGGDFNIRSKEWDINCPTHTKHTACLIDIMTDLGLDRSTPIVNIPTRYSADPSKNNTTIDLMFIANKIDIDGHYILPEYRLQSDHALLAITIPISPKFIPIQKKGLKRGSDKERSFINELAVGLSALLSVDLSTEANIQKASVQISDLISESWNKHATMSFISMRSKPWWNDECNDRVKDNWRTFQNTMQIAKRKFFDAKIEEIAEDNKRPWDLMPWVKDCKLPPARAIIHNNKPCHSLKLLWEAFDQTYNSASDRTVDAHVLDELRNIPERKWIPFSLLELSEALKSCSNTSMPGLNHVSWAHLKMLLSTDDRIPILFTRLANACLNVGYWPSHFKESVSVVIPKPNKPSYHLPKAFCPIVLLNTLGKLFEKMLAKHMQYEAVKHEAIFPSQFGGIIQ
ncbi:hypothetical protein AN958_04323 [Leucoagaricus sp. SymC.cos]|nr:hypothetical protein AN958_04323 [Leucoagaricus sp. SymC.cos]